MLTALGSILSMEDPESKVPSPLPPNSLGEDVEDAALAACSDLCGSGCVHKGSWRLRF